MSIITTNGDLIVYRDETTVTIMAPAELVDVPLEDWSAATAGLPEYPAWDVEESADFVVWTLSLVDVQVD